MKLGLPHSIVIFRRGGERFFNHGEPCLRIAGPHVCVRQQRKEVWKIQLRACPTKPFDTTSEHGSPGLRIAEGSHRPRAQHRPNRAPLREVVRASELDSRIGVLFYHRGVPAVLVQPCTQTLAISNRERAMLLCGEFARNSVRLERLVGPAHEPLRHSEPCSRHESAVRQSISYLPRWIVCSHSSL